MIQQMYITYGANIKTEFSIPADHAQVVIFKKSN